MRKPIRKSFHTLPPTLHLPSACRKQGVDEMLNLFPRRLLQTIKETGDSLAFVPQAYCLFLRDMSTATCDIDNGNTLKCGTARIRIEASPICRRVPAGSFSDIQHNGSGRSAELARKHVGFILREISGDPVNMVHKGQSFLVNTEFHKAKHEHIVRPHARLTRLTVSENVFYSQLPTLNYLLVKEECHEGNAEEVVHIS